MTWVKMVLHAFKIFILFSGCTLLFYFAILWVNQEYENYHRYEKPKGAAIKVSSDFQERPEWVQRMLLFFLDGE